jgi:hypothetical protein
MDWMLIKLFIILFHLPFPVENRPIFYMPLGKMSYAKKEETFKNYVPYLHKILKKYSNKKGIIHTNSFELSNWMRKNS